MRINAKETLTTNLPACGEPAPPTADFEFTLYDDPNAGAQIGSTATVSNVSVVDGLFTVEIDFGVDAFNGDKRWLEIAVRSPAGSGVFATLAPRQPLTAIPYALQTRGLIVDDANNVTLAPNNGNSATGGSATVGGGLLNTASGSSATVGGGATNTASSPLATVSGGRGNRADNAFATVGGGSNNTASGQFAIVGGGAVNTAGGLGATVGGGQQNAAGADYATVAGGENNTASLLHATVGGGLNNIASDQ